MHGPRLNTLQNEGVQGCRDNTLQGACENGVASMECRRRASALPASIQSITRGYYEQRTLLASSGYQRIFDAQGVEVRRLER